MRQNSVNRQKKVQKYEKTAKTYVKNNGAIFVKGLLSCCILIKTIQVRKSDNPLKCDKTALIFVKNVPQNSKMFPKNYYRSCTYSQVCKQ